jgi:starch synthase (maltosyl-transferring)
MHRLAKLGFSQSYNYFPWRNTKWELTTYLTELTRESGREYFRPSLWPNTPDILPEYLQFGGRPAFAARLVLAATLGASYGIYGPAFELCENQPREPGSEEYLHSEKYEIRDWDLPARQSQGPGCAGQPHPPGESGLERGLEPAFSRHRQRTAHRLQQALGER